MPEQLPFKQYPMSLMNNFSNYTTLLHSFILECTKLFEEKN